MEVQVIILALLPFILQIHQTSCTKVPPTYTDFIKKSCNTTTYPALCIKTLSPYAASVKANPLKLCNVALTVSINSTTSSSVTVSKLANQKYISQPDARVIKDCLGELKEAIYQLKETVNDMGHLGDADRDFEWANAKTHASAAITDADTCIDDFLGRKVNPTVKNKIKGCVSGVEKLISNALALINHLY